MQERSLILIRGLPGSGKTSLARLLSENAKYPVFSIDDYFTDVESGSYCFDHKANHLAYAACERNTELSMQEKVEKVLVDNTFTLEWEMSPYFLLAKEYGYRVFVITVENRHGSENIHGISKEQIEKMASKYKVILHP
ncbi:MAG: ATP-binding protein [Bacteroidetes bacterium]|nr:MAG: ATP-binding protein [Bacteroidota bacterium]